jgi:hypothetical protein
MGLAACQDDGKKTALSICNCMDFCVTAASRPTDRLIFLLPFPPDPERCALTCGVDHLCLQGTSAAGKCAEHIFPNAALSPAYKAIIDRRRRAISADIPTITTGLHAFAFALNGLASLANAQPVAAVDAQVDAGIGGPSLLLKGAGGANFLKGGKYFSAAGDAIARLLEPVIAVQAADYIVAQQQYPASANPKSPFLSWLQKLLGSGSGQDYHSDDYSGQTGGATTGTTPQNPMYVHMVNGVPLVSSSPTMPTGPTAPNSATTPRSPGAVNRLTGHQ